MPFGSPARVLERYATTLLTLRRKTGSVWGEAGEVSVFLDFTPGGILSAASAAGLAGESSGVAVYATPDTDVLIGDTFAHAGALYRVEWVGPVGAGPSGQAVKLCFAKAQKAPGAS